MARKEGPLIVQPPNFEMLTMTVIGTAPYVQLRFTEKAKRELRDKHEKGGAAKASRKREPKPFKELFKQSQYHLEDGSNGIPAPAFRNALIAACRAAGIVMTQAKLAVFIEADGYDEDGTPLVKITKGKPEHFESIVRNAGPGAVPDIRVRARFNRWEAKVRVRFDADMIDMASVINLMHRAGEQVGIGEGRPFSKNSTGMNWGTFTVGPKIAHRALSNRRDNANR